MAILVTGGAGYIGSHTTVKLLEEGYEVIIADNFSNSSPKVIDRIEKITSKRPAVYEADLTDADVCDRIFEENNIEAVIHFAAFKAVGESVEKPLIYYRNNLISTLNVFSSMKKHGVKSFVFSSSATVYGDPIELPICEDFPLSVTNPYGRTKLMIEEMGIDIQKSIEGFNLIILRYFNPVGAHKSGLIGEDPKGIPNNLMPYVTGVASGKLKKVNVFGDDYPTLDGTGVRDYIHIEDLAEGHVCALKKLKENPGLKIYNLGTGNGYSVLEIIKMVEEVSGVKIPYVIAPRRKGDIAECWADPSKAKRQLGWEAKYSLREMCEDAWRWQKNNPNGYDD